MPSTPELNIIARPLSERVPAAIRGAWKGGLMPAGVDLIALMMIVSDSGLASPQPQWWNCSTTGCILIGLQPRGGWQIMQRAVQWGNDSFASVFGVSCSKPTLYAYFSCSIRNRLEMWDSPAWSSPTAGRTESNGWNDVRNDVGNARIRRPTKLIDGSRGGQAFICNLLLPEKDAPYSIEAQARMQFKSILLVAAGLMNADGLLNLDEVMESEFQLSDRLGMIFRPLLIGLILINIWVIALAIAVVYSIFKDNLFGESVSFVAQASSLSLWMVSATGLLMLGGNPRIKIVRDSKLPSCIITRLSELEGKTADHKDTINIQFGSIHGSNYKPDHGSCSLPLHIVDKLCRCEIVAVRPAGWVFGMVWWSACLLLSISLQIMGAQVATVSSEIFGIAVLFIAALARGYGVAGPEEWLIPKWKRRPTATYGATLVGKMESRTDG